MHKDCNNPKYMVRKKKIVFLPYHVFSHVNAAIGFANFINSKDEFLITFAGYQPNRSLSLKNGYEYYTMSSYPFALGYEQFTQDENNVFNSYLDNLLLRLSNKLYGNRFKDLNELIITKSPDIILIDVFLYTDYVIFKKIIGNKDIKLYFMNTMMQNKHYKYCNPLLNSNCIPNNKFFVQTIIELEWSIYNYKTNFYRFLDMIKYFKRDNLSQLKSAYDKLDEKLKITDKQYIGLSYEDSIEIILNPFEFEFRFSKKYDNQFYAGNIINFNPTVNSSSKFINLLTNILSRKDKSAVIYCSFGSILNSGNRDLNNFLSKLILVSYDLNNYIFIISGVVNHESYIIRNNMYLFDFVPQSEVLKCAGVFISHGGLNSIKESIFFKVPLLLYGLSSQLDFNGNAARVTYHKIGIKGNLRDSKKEITSKIIKILENKYYKENIVKLSELIESNKYEYYKNLRVLF